MIRLNKFIADAGVCSRREADQLILDGKIKASTKTKIKGQNPYRKLLPYVFFNAIPKTQIDSFTQRVGIIFNQDILLGKIFYTNKNHSGGITKSSIKYKVYEKGDIRKILYSLYRYSLKVLQNVQKTSNLPTWILSAYQEVFTKYEPSLKDAVYIILEPKEIETIKKIKKLYPHIKILTKIC